LNSQQLILNTCPDIETAETIANLLIDQHLAACVNIVPGIRSIYRWQGQRQNDNECLLFIKTSASNYTELEVLICRHHPYEVPEIIVFNIEKGLPAYLAWIMQESHRTDSSQT